MELTEDSFGAAAAPQPARAYQGRRAGIVSRTIANIVDALVVVGIVAVIYAIVAGVSFLLHPASFHFPRDLGWSIPVIGFVVAAPYLTFGWYTTGRTYGDALLGLRVVNGHGRKLHFIIALLRAIACVVFPIGVFWVAVSGANRSVQDIVFRTSVVYDWSANPDGTVQARGRDE
jgi:uncharacterized RDD family membrane protein YckC